MRRVQHLRGKVPERADGQGLRGEHEDVRAVQLSFSLDMLRKPSRFPKWVYNTGRACRDGRLWTDEIIVLVLCGAEGRFEKMRKYTAQRKLSISPWTIREYVSHSPASGIIAPCLPISTM